MKSNNILVIIFNMCCVFYIMGKITPLKFRKNKILNIIYFLLMFLSYIVIGEFIDKSNRFFILTISTVCFSCLLLENKKQEILYTVVLQQSILFMSEVIFVIISYLFFDQYRNFWLQIPGTYFSNIAIFVIAIILINLNYIKKKVDYLYMLLKKIKSIDKYIIIISFLFVINIALVFAYININDSYTFVVDFVFIIIYAFIIYKLLYEKNENIKYYKENKSLLDSLNEYEKMLDYQKVNNHENKNQLLVIKGLVEKNDNKLIDYIDEIIKEKREDDIVLYNLSKKIPSGGLQGLIYQKMLVMKENKINLELNIEKNICDFKYENLSAKINYELCKAIGIIIDNAIDYTKNSTKKEIGILFYIDDSLTIEISNYLEKVIDLEKIYDKGFTTKGKGRGYGLSILKNIVDNNDNFENEIMIINNVFIQKLKINI